MVEWEHGLRCESCGTVYVIQNVAEKVGKRCRYCDCSNFESVAVVVNG